MPQTQTFNVTVPANHRSGETIQVRTPWGFAVSLRPPPGALPGTTLRFQVGLPRELQLQPQLQPQLQLRPPLPPPHLPPQVGSANSAFGQPMNPQAVQAEHARLLQLQAAQMLEQRRLAAHREALAQQLAATRRSHLARLESAVRARQQRDLKKRAAADGNGGTPLPFPPPPGHLFVDEPSVQSPLGTAEATELMGVWCLASRCSADLGLSPFAPEALCAALQRPGAQAACAPLHMCSPCAPSTASAVHMRGQRAAVAHGCSNSRGRPPGRR